MKRAAFHGSLKRGNLNWLCSLAAIDVLLMLLFVFPEALGAASLTQLTIARAVLTGALPVIVLVLSAMLSPNFKASLVFLKGREALPGHKAFSKYALADTRVDMSALKKNIGSLPSEPAEQNAFWYKLYKKVEFEVSVMEPHKSYLLFRDMAAMSVLLLIAVPLVLSFNSASAIAIWSATALFAAQYLVTAIAARSSGIRFVKNVLAIHSAKKVTTPRPTA